MVIKLSGHMNPAPLCLQWAPPVRHELCCLNNDCLLAVRRNTLHAQDFTSFIIISSCRRLACAEARSETKRQRYASLASEAGADNLPAVFETFGGMAAATTRLLHRLVSSHAVSPGVRTPRQFVRMIREGLSICLQRGNALIDHMGLRWATRASCRLTSPLRLPSDSRCS